MINEILIAFTAACGGFSLCAYINWRDIKNIRKKLKDSELT